MATLTKYNNFKSLKHSAIPKVKKATKVNTQYLQEMDNFITLLKKKKQKGK